MTSFCRRVIAMRRIVANKRRIAIGVEPAVSKLGKFTLHFESLPHVNGPRDEPMNFEVRRAGEPPLSAKEVEKRIGIEGKMLVEFVCDSPEGEDLLEYPLFARFIDNGEELVQPFCLRFDQRKFCFLLDTT